MNPAKILDLKVAKGRLKGRRFSDEKDFTKNAREFSSEALYALVDLLDSEDERIVIYAARELLDRAYGKPKEVILTEQNPESVEELENKLKHLDEQIKSLSV
ncbi:MAG TPA: hypothetical protein VLB84_17985 [Bacteroidia bacterium]|jgi:hypothetical protein|nr:hypothetical protein [Bacteroidia bacterium]